MKEYKVVTWKIGLNNNDERLEDTLNTYARQGWRLVQFADSSMRLVFERDKNR